MAWKLHSSYNLSSQKQVLALESGQYFEKMKLLSKPVHMSIQGLIFRFMDYLKPFAPSLLLAISLLISIVTEGQTGKNQSSQFCYVLTTYQPQQELLWRRSSIGQLDFELPVIFQFPMFVLFLTPT